MTHVTEQEAVTKWCPFSRVAIEGAPAPAHNRVTKPLSRDIQAPLAANCIASNCMAWRGNQMGRGYCGLASAPFAAFGEVANQ